MKDHGGRMPTAPIPRTMPRAVAWFFDQSLHVQAWVALAIVGPLILIF